MNYELDNGRTFKLSKKIQKIISSTVTDSGEEIVTITVEVHAPDECKCNGCRVKAEEFGGQLFLFETWKIKDLISDDRVGIDGFKNGKFIETAHYNVDSEPFLENPKDISLCKLCLKKVEEIVKEQGEKFYGGSQELVVDHAGSSYQWYFWTVETANPLRTHEVTREVIKRTMIIAKCSLGGVHIFESTVAEAFKDVGDQIVRNEHRFNISGFSSIDITSYV